MYELEEILHPRVITETYRQEACRFFHNPLVEFYSSQTREWSGDRYEFAYREAMKEPAPANFRGQPARVLQPTGSTERRVYLLHAFNEVGLSTEALRMIRRPTDQTLQEQGRREIRFQMEQFGDRHRLFRALCLAKTLTQGEIHFDAAGHVLESNSGASYSVDFAVPASHKQQLDGGSGAIIDKAWSDASAKILDDLDTVRMQAEEENAEEPRHIWLHHTAKRWLRDNTQLQSYVQGSAEKVDQVLRGSMIEDLNGWTWHFFSGTYSGFDGVTRPFIPKDQAIMTPDVGPWLRAVDGSELIAGFEGIHPGIDDAMGEISEVHGDFAYVRLVDNPTKLVLRMGTNFVYAFANPSAVWMPTVDFEA